MLCALATPDDHPDDILARVTALVDLVGDYADKLSVSPPGMEPDKSCLIGMTVVCQLVREALGQAVANRKRRAAVLAFERGLNEAGQNAGIR